MSRTPVAIVGSGNIGTDLLYKLLRSEVLEPRWMVGIDPASEGLRRARDLGLETTHEGPGWLLGLAESPALVFDATSAAVHLEWGPRLAEAGMRLVDLTPAAIGPYLVPTVNLGAHLDAPDVNLITCGGQATVPIVHAVSRVVPVAYAEIVSAVSSRSAGPGTRCNIDEFTRTTARALEVVGGAERGKAIIVLNPADPPISMRVTVMTSLPEDADTAAVAESVTAMVADVQAYVPGYQLRNEPQFEPAGALSGGRGRMTALLEVTGAGDFLPPYAGNLDIMTAAAARVGELLAETSPVGSATGSTEAGAPR
ncbi:MAG: acetaldehyde dehydrogenase [Acidimicrobiaceae bacterium]|nr:acetaldehyde dehydrogenase [Acidimicrobiaceae bacterium]